MALLPMRVHAVLISMLIGSLVYAQRTIYRTPTNDGCFRQAVKPLKAVPPDRPDMNLDLVNAYAYFDSLCRQRISWERFDSMAMQINTLEKLKPLMRCKYLLTEYDATLYGEFQSAGPYALESSKAGPQTANEPYTIAPGVIDDMIGKAMREVIGRKHKLAYLTNADLIVRIRVEAVIHDADSLASIPVSPLPLICITGKIIDTIKGIHIRQCEGADTIGTPCVSFDFSPYWQKENSRGDVISTGINELTGEEYIPCDNCYRDTSIYAGKEYIVFLRNIILDYDGTYAYYSFWPFMHYSAEGGIFPILNNGNVSIPSNYFGYGTEVPYSKFLELIREDIKSIVSH